MRYISEEYLKNNLVPSASFGHGVLVVGIGTIKYATKKESIEIDDTNIPFRPIEVPKEVIREVPVIKKVIKEVYVPKDKKERHWVILKNGTHIQCSSCKFKLPVNLKKLDSYNYCPNCGARMININKIKTFIRNKK